MPSIRTKNPLLNLNKNQQDQVIDEYLRAQYLIRGIRLAIASGFSVSIFDRIVNVSKDGETGTITRKSIDRFLNEFAESCVPAYEDYFALDEFDLPIGDYALPTSQLSIRGHDISGKSSDNARLKKYIKGFVGRVITYKLIELEYQTTSDRFPDGKIKDTKTWMDKEVVLESDKNHIKINMRAERIEETRKALLFNKVVDEFSDFCITYMYDFESLFDFQRFEDDKFEGGMIPFYDAFEDFSKMSSVFPTIPTLIREMLVEGVETYCFNNELCFSFIKGTEKTTPNDQYSEVIYELRKALNNVLNLCEQATGE